MAKRWKVKNEEPMSPSLSPTGDAQESAKFPLLPLTPGMSTDQVKAEDSFNQEGRLSPFFSLSTADLKTNPSPSQSPTLTDEFSPHKSKSSPTPTPPPSTADGTASMSPTPPPLTAPTTAPKKGQSPPVQLISDLPIARGAALATFNEITENNYQYKTLGRSREALESMTCDCTFDPGADDPDTACGADSDCINRLTQVECLPGDCRCRSHCRNQRFQKREYSDIDIVQTEKKGFGLRAEKDLPKDSFIYEYVGDVVNPISFKKRMRDYAQEGIQHFYFMMLQKDEFIDATKSGGIGRFANHSCRPNCYVAKWTVDQHVRMGIFAKRSIKRHEELTFNYNVDRYGHQAQICYCGESNCVGYIGGKTQTDVAIMDDLYFDALGITDEADLMDMKGSKKKKGKKIDDPDFMPMLKPIVEKDVPKVVQAIRQSQSRKVLSKLLTRIKISEDQATLRQIMRLRGYSLMTNLLEDHAADAELIQLALECMSKWPLLNRNKVDDSRVIIPVKAFAEQEEESKIKELAHSLVVHWEQLPMYNRIPKRVIVDGDDSDHKESIYDADHPGKKLKSWGQIDIKRTKYIPLPPRPYYHREPTPPRIFNSPPRKPRMEFSRESIRAVIEAATEAEAAKEAAAVEAAAEAEAEAAAARAKAETRKAAAAAHALKKKSRPGKKSLTEEEKETIREKRLMKLVGAIVVKCMSKHSKAMEHDQFKKHAKELTQIIADKEKKSTSYKEGKLDKLSDEKVVKIKKFSKEYIAKILRKLEKAGGKRPRASSSSTSAQAASSSSVQPETPNEHNEGNIVTMDVSMEDMEVASDSDGERDADGEDDMNGDIDSKDWRSPQDELPPQCDMDVDAGQPTGVQPPSDPRRRPPIDPPLDPSWEPYGGLMGPDTGVSPAWS